MAENKPIEVPEFITVKDIMNRWNIDFQQWVYILKNSNLVGEFGGYNHSDHAYHLRDITNFENQCPELKLAAIEYEKRQAESTHESENSSSDDNVPLTVKERREFGKLKKLRNSLPKYLEAACILASYAEIYLRERGSQLTKDELCDYLIGLEKDFDKTMFNKIWGVFPAKYKLSGRPTM